MIIAELPVTEDLRLLDLASYEILDTGPENDFDELVELAADICNCPISTITLIDKHRQWFKARRGVAKSGTSRDVAFCAHTILQDDVMVVENAVEDTRFHDNPLVTGEDDNIRFYAGAPILSPGGYKLGTICVIDHTPKELSEKQEKALTILSNQVTKLLELRRKNGLIRERAAEVITLKSNTIGKLIEKHEDEKSSMAYNLHEDIAQRLSSIKLYVNMAVADKGNRLEKLDTADQQLKELLSIVRNLSYSITPHAVNWLAAEDLISEFIEKTADTYRFNIKFRIIGSGAKKPAANALIAIRIIELWLKFLADQNTTDNIILTIDTTRNLKITIEENGAALSFAEQEKYVFESSMYERAAACGGIIELPAASGGNNVLTITLPEQDTENKRQFEDTLAAC